MLHRILVPLDGSAESESILGSLEQISIEGAELHLLHVIPNPSLPVGMPPKCLFTLPEMAYDYLERLSLRMGRIRSRVLVETGDPADAILRTALAENATLIAMTTHARSGPARLVLGSVAEEVVRNSSLPVLLARPGIPALSREVRRILVPLDGSARSARILEVLRPIAAKKGCELALLQVIAPATDPMAGMLPDRPPHMLTTDASHRLQKLADDLGAEGVEAIPLVSAGDAVEQILECAAMQNVDWIAMATHGHTGLDRLLMGSVTQSVLRRADRPVLVLRAAAAPRRMAAARASE